MRYTNWFRYLCLQAIIFTIVIESWIHAQASSEVLAKPLLYNAEEVNSVDVGLSELDVKRNSFTYAQLSKFNLKFQFILR